MVKYDTRLPGHGRHGKYSGISNSGRAVVLAILGLLLLCAGSLAPGLHAQAQAAPAPALASPSPSPAPASSGSVSPGQDPTVYPSLDRLKLGDGMKALISMALGSSQDYRAARIAMEKAQDAVEPVLLLETASLSTTISASGGGSQNEDPVWSVGTSLALPIFDQLALSASLSDQLESTMGLTVSPLKHSARFETSRLAWEKTVIQAETARKSAITQTISQVLSWQAARKTLEIRQAQVGVKSALYESAKAGYGVDPKTVTLDNVRDALKNLNTARTALASAQKTLAQARLALESNIGKDPGSAGITMPDLAEMESLVEQTRATLPLTIPLTWNPDVALARIELESAKVNLDNTWAWEPDLQIKGSLKIPADQSITWTASVILALSPEQIHPEARKIAEKTRDLAMDSLAKAEADGRNTWAQDLSALESSQDMRQSLELSLAQARELAEETRVLARVGEKTDLEVEEADLDRLDAETALWSSLADEFNAWLALLGLLP